MLPICHDALLVVAAMKRCRHATTRVDYAYAARQRHATMLAF